MTVDVNELSQEELITLEGIVANRSEWGLLRKLFNRQIAKFWDALRLTDPADETRVAANHKLAVGVEASLGAMVKEIEDVVDLRKRIATEPEVIDDQTKELYEPILPALEGKGKSWQSKK